MDVLTNKNFILYSAAHYNNPSCYDTEEFLEDLRRFKYIKKLITRYIETGELKERLILNHLIILNNVFSPTVLCKLLYLKMEEYLPYIKPFCVFLNIWQDKIVNVKRSGVFDTTSIIMDDKIIKVLRGINEKVQY